MFLLHRCKLFMTWSKPDTRVILACLRVTPGNVSFSCFQFQRNILTGACAVQAMQSEYILKPQIMLLLTICELDYAINNHLTPFISMQNHYNLVYREEEREMMPTLKVPVPSTSAVHCFSHDIFFLNDSTLAWVRFLGPHWPVVC